MVLATSKGMKDERVSKMSDLDKARKDYTEVRLSDLENGAEIFKANAVTLSKIIKSKFEDRANFGFLNFYNDQPDPLDSEKVVVMFKSKYLSDKIVVYQGNKLFPLIQAIEEDYKSEYFEIPFPALQKYVEKIESIDIEGIFVESEDDERYDYYTYNVLSFTLKSKRSGKASKEEEACRKEEEKEADEPEVE